MWLDPFCRNLELAAQAEHEDDLPENLSEIADLWGSPTRTHVRPGGVVWVGAGHPGLSPELASGKGCAQRGMSYADVPVLMPPCLSPGNFWA